MTVSIGTSALQQRWIGTVWANKSAQSEQTLRGTDEQKALEKRLAKSD